MSAVPRRSDGDSGESTAVCQECERSVTNHWDLIQAMARRGPQYLREALALAGDDPTVLTVTNEELQYAWGQYEAMKADRDLALAEKADLRAALEAIVGGVTFDPYRSGYCDLQAIAQAALSDRTPK